MNDTINVRQTYCPFWERTTYELWNGQNPIIAANNYLRANLARTDNTLQDKAYSLLPFFRFLQRNSLDFLELNPQTITPFISHFCNELLFRVRQTDGFAEPKTVQERDGTIRKLGYERASTILSEVGWLCEWWGLIKRRPDHSITYGSPRWRFGNRMNGLPDAFILAVPRARKKFRENHVLELNEVEAIWEYVTVGSRPQKPTVLMKNPLQPGRGWSLARRLSWKRFSQLYRERIAWFHRQQMLWALMISSGMRRSEIPLLMMEDVRFRGADLWITIRPRKVTETLGRAKTGPRTIFIGWDNRVVTAWQNWSRSRLVLIDKWTRQNGRGDHEMFLTNRDGGPLTVEGLSSLFDSLNGRFQIFGGEFEEDQFAVHPHALRHTLKTLLEEWGVPQDVIQRHLGHRTPQTTDLYGRIYRKTYVDSLSLLTNPPAIKEAS